MELFEKRTKWHSLENSLLLFTIIIIMNSIEQTLRQVFAGSYPRCLLSSANSFLCPWLPKISSYLRPRLFHYQTYRHIFHFSSFHRFFLTTIRTSSIFQVTTHGSSFLSTRKILLGAAYRRGAKTIVASWHCHTESFCASGKFLRATPEIAMGSFRTPWKISR